MDVDVRHAASENQQWQTFEDTRAALMGVYGLMRSALAENNSYWAYGELRMGDFTVYNSNDLKAVVNNELRNPQTYLEELSDWRRFYAVINAASVFIEKAPQTVELDKAYSEANLKYDIAQVRLLRAFSYFYMVRIWGMCLYLHNRMIMVCLRKFPYGCTDCSKLCQRRNSGCNSRFAI